MIALCVCVCAPLNMQFRPTARIPSFNVGKMLSNVSHNKYQYFENAV